MQLVLIDDDALNRRLLARFLTGAGFEVIGEAGDGQTGLELLETLQPDLIITDCQMPRLDGMRMVQALRKGGNHTPILMFSGQCDPRVIARARQAGVDRYLSKPLHPQRLLETLREMAAEPLAV